MDKMRLERYMMIRTLFLLLALLLPAAGAFAQSSTKNYVQTKTYLNDTGTSFLRHIDYYDELGFVSETVDVGGNTTLTPVVVKTDYNSAMKPRRQWSPIAATSLDYLDTLTYAGQARFFYNDAQPYSENSYDDFHELSSSRKAGNSWSSHPDTIIRTVVNGGVIRKYSVDSNGNLVINDNSYYPYGLLTSATTIDADGRSVTVFTDFHGNTVLERRGSDNDTYYVYDQYGRLSYVLPPMCKGISDTSILSKYWYRYKYDDRGRCIWKQLPGCEPIQYWYDNANRIESEQDGYLREKSQYRNYRYDGTGRLMLQTINATRGQATETNAVVVEVKNYYDDYTCRQELAQRFSIWSDSLYATSPESPAVSRGRLTATLSYTSDGKKYFEMYRYDTEGRVSYKLCAYSDNWLKAVHTSYNFSGDVASVLESVYTHSQWQKVLLARRRISNTYHLGTRLLAYTTVSQTDKNGTTSSQVVSQPTYDVFGNVTADNRPGTSADMTYTYDTLHGWVSGISSPSGFSEQLLRETAQNAQFSGNIGSIKWQNTSNGELHGYDYTYDGLGRLTEGRYTSFTKMVSGYYDELVSYNANGSIETLQRKGMKNNGTFGLIDDLSIEYDGNHLLKVTDAAEALNYNGALDFNDGANADCEYHYDSNGALTYDSNRGITSITYDYGHRPYKISMQTKKRTHYNCYTSDGRKLLSKHEGMIPTGTGYYRRFSTTDLYIDGLIVRDGEPLLWQFDGGYVELDTNGTPTSWNYYITDHLGSTRKVVDSNNNVKETINYYPFGSEMRIQDPALIQQTDNNWHPFRFTGKELDNQNGLNMYDFGARWFDVAGVPMWTSVDPLAEKYYNISPYVYCNNNPVMFIDPDGRDYGVTIDSEKQTITITATYYATSDSYESAKSSVDMINAQSGKFQYEMNDIPSTVNFNLKAEDIKSNNIGDLNWKKAMDDSGEANTYLVVPDDYNKMDENTNGRTMGGQDIFVKSSRSKSETGGHEIGHTLGMTHNESGLMTADSSNKMRSKEFNQRDINDMIRYPLNHDRNSDAGKGFLK